MYFHTAHVFPVGLCNFIRLLMMYMYMYIETLFIHVYSIQVIHVHVHCVVEDSSKPLLNDIWIVQ